ncbi:hypothetical protein PMI07_000868 [Rhizobium sp. CF080]|uniref:hypothetical protein n=1 Tax=Rhizobium sp. (strain CF080) TaxID=1144310 RepID=UPI000271CD37|nr:hypothetical protein [Rhizobium sp. CF080]EUB97292.1 hypothetical protein PMI07_000868 [Rhizobium sp. CF080]
MFRSPFSITPVTDGRGVVTGTRYFFDELDEDQREEIIRKIPRAKISDRGVIEVIVPADDEEK